MKKPAAFLFTLLTAMALAACTGSSEPAGTSAPAVGRTIGETGIHEVPDWSVIQQMPMLLIKTPRPVTLKMRTIQ